MTSQARVHIDVVSVSLFAIKVLITDGTLVSAAAPVCVLGDQMGNEVAACREKDAAYVTKSAFISVFITRFIIIYLNNLGLNVDNFPGKN